VDGKKNIIALPCLPHSAQNPAGPNARYSARFAAKGGPAGGVEIGRCVYPCGRNEWKVCLDNKGVFTKSTWTSRELKFVEVQVGLPPQTRKSCLEGMFTGGTTTFTNDLTVANLVAADPVVVPAPQPRRAAACAGAIADATIVPLGTDLSGVVLDGTPIGTPGGEGDMAQGYAQSTVLNSLDAGLRFGAPGDTVTGTGELTNRGTVAHTYAIATFGVNVSGITPPADITLGPGESASYSLSGVVISGGPAALVTYAYAETCDPLDADLDAVVFVPPPALNHFQCYERARDAFASVAGVTLDDRFGAQTVMVRRPARLCNPADKNGEDPTAPADPDHLIGYQLRPTTSPLGKVSGVYVLNQFGVTVVDLGRPDLLLVPTAKSLTGPPAPATPGIDHLACYKTRRARFRTAGVGVADQFGPLTVDLKRPVRLCVPVDKNGEGIDDERSSLLCYQERTQSSFADPGSIFIDNQFETSEIAVTRPTELCVPAIVTTVTGL
jgi:hypothetical protein